jgi:uncharacterized protein
MMKKINKSYIRTVTFTSVLLMVISTLPAASQQQVKGAYGGSNGIFIYLKDVTPTSSDNIAYCSIERRDVNSEWKTVDVSKKPSGESDFLKRLKTAIVNLSYDVSFVEKKGPQIWKKYEESQDSLRMWFGMLPVQEALGIVYHDMTAKPQVKYEYKIQQFDRNDKLLQTLYYLPAEYPGKRSKWEVPYRNYKTLKGQITVTWGAPGAKLPPFVKVFRQERHAGEWAPVSSVIFSSTSKDSIFITAMDVSVTQNAVYRYKLVPMDLFGNPGTETETDPIAAYNFSMEAPVVQELKAVNSVNAMGIDVTWLISRNDLVNSIRIFRSIDYDKDYIQIAEVPSTVSVFTDQAVVPNKKYYYQIKLTGPMGELSTPSARVFGVSDDTSKPLPPMIVKATGTKNGILLTIKVGESNLSGVRIFRKSDKEKELIEVSSLLPVKDRTVIWEDTSNISGIRFYGYAAKAENASHLQGDFSDTVFSRSAKPSKVPAVMGLTAEFNETYNQLYWINMKFGDNRVAGYIIYRKELPKGEMKQLTDTLISGEVNSYADRTINERKSYAYSVVLVDEFGNKSAQCDPVSVKPPITPVRPPVSVTGNSDDTFIIISWGAVQSPTLKEYKVYRYIRGTKPVVVATVPVGQLTEFTDKNVSKSQLYFYYVTTIDQDGRQSNPSNEINVRKK